MLVLAGLASQQWGRKSGAAKSVVSLVDTGGAGALSAHAEKLGVHLLQVAPPPAECRAVLHGLCMKQGSHEGRAAWQGPWRCTTWQYIY